MSEKNIFEMATRGKYRFPYRGQISVEDLWDLGVTALDSIFKTLNSQSKAAKEESLLDVKSAEDEILTTQIEIVKYIVSVKQEEANARLKAKERKEQKQKIMSAIARKEDEAIEKMSKEDLQKMLDELD